MPHPTKRAAKGRTKKVKRIKLEPKPRIRRRLLKKWSLLVRTRDGHQCIRCGMNATTPGYTKLDAHHYLQKNIKDCPLKYDVRNGGTLCPACHKFDGERSAHKSPIVFYEWLRTEHAVVHAFILQNSSIRVDLDNRAVLEEIERRLDAGEHLDLAVLLGIDRRERENKESVNEANSDGRVIAHMPGEQKHDATVSVSGDGNTRDETSVPEMERAGSAQTASA